MESFAVLQQTGPAGIDAKHLKPRATNKQQQGHGTTVTNAVPDQPEVFFLIGSLCISPFVFFT